MWWLASPAAGLTEDFLWRTEGALHVHLGPEFQTWPASMWRCDLEQVTAPL